MKLTRIAARGLFFNLGQVALKEMDAAVLETVMANFDAARKINDDFAKMAEELAKRLYGDPQTMDEEQKKAYSDFMELLGKYEKAAQSNGEEANELREAAKAAYPELFALYEKQMTVLTGLLNKEIEADIRPVDKAKFEAGIIKGNAGWTAFKVDGTFGAMFEKEDETTDFSELDEMLK